MEIVLPAGPVMSALTSATVLPVVAALPIDMMRSPTCRCTRALPEGVKDVISNPPKGEETMVAPIPVRRSVVAGALVAPIVTCMPLLGSKKISTYLQKQAGSCESVLTRWNASARDAAVNLLPIILR